MAKRASLRASDADRERVAERLHQAAVEGRLVAHELEERLATALRARTYGDLDAVVADLPGTRVATRQRSYPRELAAGHPLATVAVLVALTMVVVVMAMVVIAGLLAFSGVWMLVALIMLAHRGGRGGGRPGRYGYDGGRRAGAARAPRSAR